MTIVRDADFKAAIPGRLWNALATYQASDLIARGSDGLKFWGSDLRKQKKPGLRAQHREGKFSAIHSICRTHPVPRWERHAAC